MQSYGNGSDPGPLSSPRGRKRIHFCFLCFLLSYFSQKSFRKAKRCRRDCLPMPANVRWWPHSSDSGGSVHCLWIFCTPSHHDTFNDKRQRSRLGHPPAQHHQQQFVQLAKKQAKLGFPTAARDRRQLGVTAEVLYSGCDHVAAEVRIGTRYHCHTCRVPKRPRRGVFCFNMLD